MITNILLTGKHNIRINEHRKMMAGDNVLNVDKDIPFVRYKFKEYTDTEIEYIKKMKEAINKSAHLVQVYLDENTPVVLQKLADLNVAKYVYVTVTTEHVTNGAFDTETMRLVEGIRGMDIDRIMLLDKSDNLYMESKQVLIKQLIMTLRTTKDKFGVCSSPLAFEGNQCLSAIKARELLSLYSSSTDVALPSANHQSMECCGCIRHIVIDSDTPDVVEATAQVKNGNSNTKKKKNNKDVSKDKEVKDKKAVKKKAASKGNITDCLF